MTANVNDSGDNFGKNEDRTPEIEETASLWAARRARGLSADEELAFAEWIQRDRRHSGAVANLEATWNELDKLRALAPALGTGLPNSNFFRPRRRRSARWVPVGLAAAAAILLCVGVWRSPHLTAVPAAEVVKVSRHLDLPDGSGVDLKEDALVAVDFSDAERRVHLERGEAHFTVAKNPARPFLVLAQGVVVRAVGTVFSVSLQPNGVAVAVTEGKVRVASDVAAQDNPNAVQYLVAGERLLVTPRAQIASLVETAPAARPTPRLSWEGEELVFIGQPLGAVVEQFNLHSSRKLVIRDTEIGAIRVGGKFRADNAEGFVRLLESGFGISAERKGDEIVLRRAE